MSRMHLTSILIVASCLNLPSRARSDDAPASEKPVQGQNAAHSTEAAKSQPAPEQPSAPAGDGAVRADLDNDGFVDLFISNVSQQPAGPTPPQVLSNYWIGIDGTPVDDAFRSQLELPEGQGLLINQVVDDSPAAKAGLKQHDILISCHDASIAQIGDLAKILDEKKGTLLPLKLVRAGKRMIIEVTPQRRPPSQTGDTCPAISKEPDQEFVRRVWLDVMGVAANDDDVQQFIADKREKKRELLVNRLLRKSTHTSRSCTACHAGDGDAQRIYYHTLLDNGTVRFNVNVLNNGDGTFQDLTVLPAFIQGLNSVAHTQAAQELPDDVTVSITRKGKEPAKIAVRKGDRIWEISEREDADKIPEEVRTYAGPFFSSMRDAWESRLAAFSTNPAGAPITAAQFGIQSLARNLGYRLVVPTMVQQPAADANPQPSTSESAFQRLDKQLESLGGQLGDLRQAMQELHKTLESEKAKSATPEKK